MSKAPAWMSKHPCSGCGRGYGFCIEGWRHSLMCCKDCDHPSHRDSNPWTSEDVIAMWEGKEMPKRVKEGLQQLLALERTAS